MCREDLIAERVTSSWGPFGHLEEPTVTSNEITTGAPSLSRRIASEVLPMIVVALPPST